MSDLGFFSVTDQVARHLTAKIKAGHWVKLMPGRNRLVAELGVSGKTVESALKKLEELGVLAAEGSGKARRILAHPAPTVRVMRVAIIPYEGEDRSLPYMVDLQRRMDKAGHHAEFVSESVLDLDRSIKRMATFVRQQRADAWVLMGAPLSVSQWFVERRIPAFALFGRRRGLNLSGGGPDKIPAMRDVLARLHALGHRRISLISRQERRKPFPGAFEQAFLDGLQGYGLATSTYNLPDWDDTPDGFRQCLESLFKLTPPTALILDEAYQYLAARQFLARYGVIAPQHISLICCDPAPWFDWYWPHATHIHWDPAPLVRHMVRWVNQLANNKDDRSQVKVRATLIEGGTMGKAPGHRIRLRLPAE